MKPIKNRPRQVPKTPLKVSSSSGSDSDKKIHDPVEVFCRLKPRTDYQDDSCITVSSPTTLTLISPDSLKNRKTVLYTFNHIFKEYADQKEVFDHIGMPLLRGLVQGKDGLLFTYGVTGSGKTYTMTGERNNPGITPRCIDTLFNTIADCQIPKFTIKSDKMNGFEIQSDVDALGDRMQEVKQKRRIVKKSSSDSDLLSYSNDGTTIPDINLNALYAVFISYVEIYNNIAYDLLDENVATKSLQAKILREDSNHNVYVNGVTEVEVKTTSEALELYSMGKKRKRMAQTSLNSESSRSHSVFTIRVVAIPADIQSEIVRERNLFTAAQLSLVDLAGSERCARSQTSGQRLKEAGSINNSLMSLRTCLEVLRENQITGTYRIVPYRESRLTHLFKKFFEGEGKVEMIVCVNPSSKDYDETVHVMKFAEMTQDVKVSRADAKKIETDGIPRRPLDNKLSTNEDLPSLVSIGVQTNFESPEKMYRSPIERMPQVRLIDPDCEEIQELILYLKRRRHYLRKFKIISKLSSNFRVRLSELQNTECNYQNQITHVIPAHREEVKILKKKISKIECLNNEAEEKCAEQDEAIESYQRMLEETNFKLKQNMIEKMKQKRIFEEKRTHELDAKLRKQRDILKSAMKNDLEKIELVKDILTDKIPISGISTVVESTVNIKNDGRNETEVNENQYKHVPRRDAPVANVRYRRSRSAGDRWLEHRPANPTPLGTVLQPVFKCHKSVRKLTNMKDVVSPKQSKYLLISQGQDDVGDLETKLYKGDIIPTCTGGAQVIFDDVEKLKQESPTRMNIPKNNLKRSQVNAYDGDDKKPRRQ